MRLEYWTSIKSFLSTPSLASWLVVILVGVFVLQWLAWIFGYGRFKKPVGTVESNSASANQTTTQAPIRYVIANLFAKLVDDFRHLLALILVLMFAIVLVYSLYVAGTKVDDISKAMQAVTGSLSGIIGVIIGYYFGESAAKRGSDPANPLVIANNNDDDDEQQEDGSSAGKPPQGQAGDDERPTPADPEAIKDVEPVRAPPKIDDTR